MPHVEGDMEQEVRASKQLPEEPEDVEDNKVETDYESKEADSADELAKAEQKEYLKVDFANADLVPDGLFQHLMMFCKLYQKIKHA